jgi:hypothetical protein
MAVENGHVIFFFFTEERYVHTQILSFVSHVFINLIFVSSVYFSSVMTTVANLKIKTTVNTSRMLEGTDKLRVLSRPCVTL